MQDGAHTQALSALAKIRRHLQAAYLAARELEAAVPPKPLDRLSDHIGSVSAAADWIREEVEARAEKKSPLAA